MTYAIGLLCLLLSGLLGLELLPANAGEQPATTSPAALPPAAAGVQVPPVAAWADIALGRPLFAPDRRAPQAGPAAAVALPRLAGTIRSDERLLAIFQPDGTGRPLVVARDAAIAGWIVADIADGTVTLVRGGSTAILRIGFANQAVVLKPSGPPGTVLLHAKRTDPFLAP